MWRLQSVEHAIYRMRFKAPREGVHCVTLVIWKATKEGGISDAHAGHESCWSCDGGLTLVWFLLPTTALGYHGSRLPPPWLGVTAVTELRRRGAASERGSVNCL